MEFEVTGGYQDSDGDSLEELEESEFLNLPISSSVAKKNYEMAGKEVPEEQDHISIADYPHLLNDHVHQSGGYIMSDSLHPVYGRLFK